jgi:CBS domain containing-hemolysin-like protein
VLFLLLPAYHWYARLLAPLVALLRRRAALEQASPGPVEEAAPGPPRTEVVPPPPIHEKDDGKIVDSLARFASTQVKEVMTPRPDVVAVAGSATVAELRRVLRETKYSRVPVYGENLDDIVGVVTVRDLVEYEGEPEAPALSLARPVHMVPETKRIADLLRDLQARRLTFALVIDEYGGTAGVVSVEDIVEEIVGEIKDEYDVEAEPIAVDTDGSVLVAGRVSVDRLEQALETPLAEDGEVGTVGGLATAVFGRIPRVGETIVHRGFLIEVLDAERKRVNRVRFRRLPVEEEGQ